jgi:hypothetical protein
MNKDKPVSSILPFLIQKGFKFSNKNKNILEIRYEIEDGSGVYIYADLGCLYHPVFYAYDVYRNRIHKRTFVKFKLIQEIRQELICYGIESKSLQINKLKYEA